MRARSSLSLLLIASSLLAACASGPHRGGPGGRRGEAMPPLDPAKREQIIHEMIDRWDFDGDGQATCKDMDLQRERLFKILDKNKDGEIGPTEYREAQFEDKAFMFYGFLRVDTDSSGTISLAELSKIPHSLFNAADKDHDCVISPEEALSAYREANAGMMMGRRNGDERKGARPPRGGGDRDDGGLLPPPGE